MWQVLVNGILKCDQNKRMIALTSDYIKQLSLYLKFIEYLGYSSQCKNFQ